MLMGRAAASDAGHARQRYLARHPDAAAYAGFGDFAFYAIDLKRVHLVAGFGRIVDIDPADLLTAVDDAEALVEAETEVIVHMNEDHAEACRLYAVKLLGAADGAWRCVGCDPEGLDLQLDRVALRLTFPHRVNSPGALRQVLKQLADQARAT
jgi:putative heme iron utilization protein